MRFMVRYPLVFGPAAIGLVGLFLTANILLALNASNEAAADSGRSSSLVLNLGDSDAAVFELTPNGLRRVHVDQTDLTAIVQSITSASGHGYCSWGNSLPSTSNLLARAGSVIPSDSVYGSRVFVCYD